ncbi:MAG: dihydrofolate reductase [Actinomycetota bacterium]|nr:MAG: dihydrofolate reductase [Actinomycetota bacterium]
MTAVAAARSTLVVGSDAGPELTALLRAALGDRAGVDIVEIDPARDPGSARPTVLFAGFRRDGLPPAWLTDVRWVHVPSAGIDGIAADLFDGRLVTGGRGIAADPIAEYVVHALLLAAKGDLWVNRAWVRQTDLPVGGPRMLGDSTVGLVGLGAIGTAIATRLQAFGTRTVAVRATTAPAAVAGVELLPTLAAMLPHVDHLVVAVPATPATRALIGAEAFARVKRGVHLVNVARGSVVDHDALRDALDDGQVGSATLDVTDPEPLPDGHWLLSHPRVRVSPHLSFQRPSVVSDVVGRFVDNVDRYQAGEPLLGVVDPIRGY